VGNKLEGLRGCDNHKAKLLNLKLTYQTTQHHNNKIVSTAVDYVIELQMFDDDDDDNYDDNNGDGGDGGDSGDSGDSGATMVHTVTLLTYAKLARV
jgi:hypothetical protein